MAHRGDTSWFRAGRPWVVSAAVAALLGEVALAQDMPTPTPVPATPQVPGQPPAGPVPPDFRRSSELELNFAEVDLLALLRYVSQATNRPFILHDTRELEGKKVTILSNRRVAPEVAYQAFLSALELHGMTVVRVGELHKVVKASEAQKQPGPITRGDAIARSDQYITHVITLENVSVSDVREIVDNLVSSDAKVLAYAPTNTLILTDTGYNIRRIYDILMELDIAAPRATLQIYPIVYADAGEIKRIIEELYGTAEQAQDDRGAARSATTAAARRRRAARDEPEPQEGVTAGKESNYISKVISDERTNSLIVRANEQGHAAVADLIARLDVDVDPTSRSQIFVYRLEHAKAEDVAQVLQDLGQDNRSRQTGRGGNQDAVDTRVAAQRAQAARTAANAASADSSSETGGAVAAFEKIRIAPDETTNSLVIIASRDDYEIIRSVIEQLDVKRKMVFVDTVILELSSTDSNSYNLAYHGPLDFFGGAATGMAAAGYGMNSLGFTADQALGLSGLTMGVFGQTLEIPVLGQAGATMLEVPSFGIALEALKTMQMVNIVSTPSLAALDNEEAKIVVGRKIPFPTSSGLNSLGQPVISYQREDVAITLEMTPRINSENYVTLELKVEVQEIEESDAIDVRQSGFITSNREIETVVLVGDNQTVVLGGLVGSTETEAETKIPVLGDLPILGALFRNRSKGARRTNLLVFLTPHIIDDDSDMEEIMRVKEAQRAEFMRRFYGKSQDEQFAEIRRLLQFSMNHVDRPSVYRGPTSIPVEVRLDGEPVSTKSRDELERMTEGRRRGLPGETAGSALGSDVSVEVEPVDVAVPSGSSREPVIVPVEGQEPVLVPDEPELAPVDAERPVAVPVED